MKQNVRVLEFDFGICCYTGDWLNTPPYLEKIALLCSVWCVCTEEYSLSVYTNNMVQSVCVTSWYAMSHQRYNSTIVSVLHTVTNHPFDFYNLSGIVARTCAFLRGGTVGVNHTVISRRALRCFVVGVFRHCA